MAKFEFPLYLAPENALITNVSQVPNKLSDHSEATFAISLNNAINRTIIIESIDFRLANSKTQQSLGVSRGDASRSSAVARSSLGAAPRVALKYLHPKINDLQMLKNESLGVLLSITKDMNFLVGSQGLQATDNIRRVDNFVSVSGSAQRQNGFRNQNRKPARRETGTQTRRFEQLEIGVYCTAIICSRVSSSKPRAETDACQV